MNPMRTLILCMAGAMLCIVLTGCGEKAQDEKNAGASTGVNMGGPPGASGGGTSGGAPTAPK